MSLLENDSSRQEQDKYPSRNSLWMLRIVELIQRLKKRYLLFVPLFIFFLLTRVLIYLLVPPEYTATAIIGPPNPSPITSMINGTTGLAGAARRLVGGSGSGAGNDPFQEYLQLMQSDRLAIELDEKDHLLPIIFYKRWNAKNHRWDEPGLLSNALNVVKRLLNQPVHEYPDADLLREYLQKHFSISQATTGQGLSSLMGPSYMSVSLSYKDPRQAEQLLNTILYRADEIIRQEQLKDVLARISYISSELPNVSQTEQRDALIETLSSQEELKIMMVADKRFASILVDMPHAAPQPTSPMALGPALIVSFLLSLATWVALVAFEPKSKIVSRALSPFTGKTRRLFREADALL